MTANINCRGNGFHVITQKHDVKYYDMKPKVTEDPL